MVNQVQSQQVYIKLQGDLAVPLPTNLHIGLLQNNFGVTKQDGYSSNIPLSIGGDIVRDRVQVFMRQSFEVFHHGETGSVNVIYYAETLGKDGSSRIPIEELPEGVVDQEKGVILLSGLDNLLAVPSQIVQVSFYQDILSPQDQVDYNLSFYMKGDTLVSVDAKHFDHQVNVNNSLPQNYQDTLQLLIGDYSGILNVSEEEIEAQELDGRRTVEDIVDILVPSIVKKLS